MSYNYYVCFTPFYSSFADLGNNYAGLQSKPQLPDLINVVSSKVAAKWKHISLHLGLTLNDQKYFMELTLGDPKQHFTFVFTVWKSRATKPYPWSTVIQALEAPAVEVVYNHWTGLVGWTGGLD